MPGIVGSSGFCPAWTTFIASFTAGSGATTYRWKSLAASVQGRDINALSVILILVSGLVAFVAEYIRYKHRILPNKGTVFSPIQSRQTLSLLVPLWFTPVSGPHTARLNRG